MLKVRALRFGDVLELERIHNSFYKDEFELPDLYNGFLTAFIIEDENHEVITAGGLRTITEAILITDKNKTVRERRCALLESMQVFNFVCNKLKYGQFHAFVQDEVWKNQLIKSGFRETKGQSLVIDTW